MEKQSEKGAKDQRYCGEKNTDIGKRNENSGEKVRSSGRKM